MRCHFRSVLPLVALSTMSPRERLLVQPVQEVSLSVFDQLDAQDILFIDSSHVAKIGSDLAIIFLRILPRLRRGVLVHFHDIFYPFSYPVSWIRDGPCLERVHISESVSHWKPGLSGDGFQPICRLFFPRAFPRWTGRVLE